MDSLLRPTSIIWFERFLLTALAIDATNNLASWNSLSTNLVAKGMSPNAILLLLMCLAAPTVGLLFWYFVARRASNLARWILTILVVLGGIGFVAVLLHRDAGDQPGILFIAALAELLKVLAVALLFTEKSAGWFVASLRRKADDGRQM